MSTTIESPIGIAELKPHIEITKDAVQCPVKGCSIRVKRQAHSFKKAPEFTCDNHGITISPSTFQYPSETANILNTAPEELELLALIKKAKRESRMARERSEDAVTWNVFRSLQNSGALSAWLGSAAGTDVGKVEDVVYWSYSTATKQQWQELNDARKAFGERIHQGSEPDVAVVTERTVFFIECKLDAPNKTSGTGKTLEKRLGFRNYSEKQPGWFSRVFASDYQTVVKAQRYELLRFWLLGSWLAKQKLKRHFCLLLLLRHGVESGIHQDFLAHIREDSGRTFARRNWEDVYRSVGASSSPDGKLLAYMGNKTLGYDSEGNLRKAFAV